MGKAKYINPIFEESLANVPAKRRREAEISYGIARRIHEVLQKKRWSQADLAKMVGKDDATVSRWMSGQHNFTIRTIAMIEDAIGERILDVRQNRLSRRYSSGRYRASVHPAVYLNEGE